jgi:hypothetical protein
VHVLATAVCGLRLYYRQFFNYHPCATERPLAAFEVLDEPNVVETAFRLLSGIVDSMQDLAANTTDRSRSRKLALCVVEGDLLLVNPSHGWDTTKLNRTVHKERSESKDPHSLLPSLNTNPIALSLGKRDKFRAGDHPRIPHFRTLVRFRGLIVVIPKAC